mmetsp:Transcript_11322/g.41431  ORF Transcript_11322/g.41431 Transcript_11322/m.41431 type:complete len:219 (+) Transcript_11322:3-659(+)
MSASCMCNVRTGLPTRGLGKRIACGHRSSCRTSCYSPPSSSVLHQRLPPSSGPRLLCSPAACPDVRFYAWADRRGGRASTRAASRSAPARRAQPPQAALQAAASQAPTPGVPGAVAWVLLVLAIVFEVLGTTAMKLSNGFQNPLFTVTLVVCYVASLAVFTLVLKWWTVSTAYAVWSGVGTALTAMVGVLYFKEVMTLVKAASILCIIVGVVGLNLGM